MPKSTRALLKTLHAIELSPEASSRMRAHLLSYADMHAVQAPTRARSHPQAYGSRAICARYMPVRWRSYLS